ncbi:hypothetical protein J6590_029091 [Homalodisca vitripennis]|nr:hypothetical protein J6590_029091 [Homalodisca vitripennis]
MVMIAAATRLPFTTFYWPMLLAQQSAAVFVLVDKFYRVLSRGCRSTDDSLLEEFSCAPSALILPFQQINAICVAGCVYVLAAKPHFVSHNYRATHLLRFQSMLGSRGSRMEVRRSESRTPVRRSPHETDELTGNGSGATDSDAAALWFLPTLILSLPALTTDIV